MNGEAFALSTILLFLLFSLSSFVKEKQSSLSMVHTQRETIVVAGTFLLYSNGEIFFYWPPFPAKIATLIENWQHLFVV